MNRLFYRFFRCCYEVRCWFIRRFTTHGLVVLLGLIVSAAVGLDTNQSLAYQIFTFLVALVTVAISTSQFFRFRFGATRILPRFGTVGLPLKYRVILHPQMRKAQKELILHELCTESYPSFKQWMTGTRGHQWQWGKSVIRFPIVPMHRRVAITQGVDLPLLQPNRPTEVTVEVKPLQRGVLRLTGLTVACPDPLGLFKACVTLRQPQSILILPKRYQLPPIDLPGLRRHQSGGVALASSVGDSEEFRALRDYRPGDSPRKIHWKSWAKVGKPIVKEEQEEYFVRHALILDTFQRDSHSKILEEAISVAASFACEVQTQESLLDLMFIGLESHCFTAGRGLGDAERMLELLAAVEPCQHQSFESLIPTVVDRLSLLSGCICILLAWDEARQSLVQHFRRMQIPALVFVIVPNEFVVATHNDPPNPLKKGEQLKVPLFKGDLGGFCVAQSSKVDITSNQSTSKPLLSEYNNDPLVSIRMLKLGEIQEGLMSP
jgi:hypothetical protein